MAPSGNRSLPGDVFLVAPMKGSIAASHSIVIGPAPVRPIGLGSSQRGDERESGQRTPEPRHDVNDTRSRAFAERLLHQLKYASVLLSFTTIPWASIRGFA